MRCLSCGVDHAYVSCLSVECVNPVCQHYNQAWAKEQIPSVLWSQMRVLCGGVECKVYEEPDEGVEWGGYE